MKKKTIYEPVKVGDEMPPLKERVSISMDGGITFPYEAVGKNWKPEEVGYTHWLKQSEKYVLSEEELRESLKECWMDGYTNGCGIEFDGTGYTTPKEFLNSKGIPETKAEIKD